MTRAAIYARVSSAGQRDRHTIESQLRVLPAYVASQGWTLVETYVDDGRSAATGKLEARDGFARLVVDADARRFDVIVVVHLDRLTRTNDLEERARILGPFQRNGIQIVTPHGGALDLRTMLGELYATIEAITAAEEKRKIAARTLEGRITAARRGRLPAGRPPWGLAFDRETGAWSTDAVRGPVVVELFERVARGDSCRAVADDLDARGVPRERGRWHRGRVATIIRSRYPVGEWVADAGRGLVVAVPRLVDDALWQRAQDAIAETRRCRRGFRRTLRDYLLEGLAVCGACGAPIGIRTGVRGGPSAYLCTARREARKGSDGRCMAPILAAPAADVRAWTAIRRELEDPALAAAVAGELAGRDGDRRDWEADAAGWRRKLERLVAAEREHLGRRTRGLVSAGACDAELARIARERAALQQQLAAAGRAGAAAGVIAARLSGAGAILEQLRDQLANAPFAARRALVQLLVRPGGIRFVGEDLQITLWVPRSPAALQAGPAVASVDASSC